MNGVKFVLLACSATSFAASLLVPTWCWWCAFFWILPIFYCAFTATPLRFLEGFFWGTVFFGIIFFELFFLVGHHGNGTYKMVIPLFVILYSATHAGLWFWCASTLSRIVKNSGWGVYGSWALCSWLYCIFTYTTLLWFFGVWRGCCFMWPLVPLAVDARWLWVLPYSGEYVLLGVLVVLCASTTYAYVYKNLVHGLIVCGMTQFFLVGWYVPKAVEAPPTYVGTIAYVRPPGAGVCSLDCAQAINARIEQALERCPDAQIVLLPESAFPFALDDDVDSVKLWCNNALCGGQTLLIGAHKKEGHQTYNCLFCVEQMLITHDYVKTIAMPFAEFVPFPWRLLPCACTLFLQGKQGFSSKNSDGLRIFSTKNGFSYRPYICCELFFNGHLHERATHEPFVCLVNDSWFCMDTVKKLMCLCARYRALERYNDVIYISHEFGVWMSKTGSMVDLARC